jgi:hypothetical protein
VGQRDPVISPNFEEKGATDRARAMHAITLT